MVCKNFGGAPKHQQVRGVQQIDMRDEIKICVDALKKLETLEMCVAIVTIVTHGATQLTSAAKPSSKEDAK